MQCREVSYKQIKKDKRGTDVYATASFLLQNICKAMGFECCPSVGEGVYILLAKMSNS